MSVVTTPERLPTAMAASRAAPQSRASSDSITPSTDHCRRPRMVMAVKAKRKALSASRP